MNKNIIFIYFHYFLFLRCDKYHSKWKTRSYYFFIHFDFLVKLAFKFFGVEDLHKHRLVQKTSMLYDCCWGLWLRDKKVFEKICKTGFQKILKTCYNFFLKKFKGLTIPVVATIEHCFFKNHESIIAFCKNIEIVEPQTTSGTYTFIYFQTITNNSSLL